MADPYRGELMSFALPGPCEDGHQELKLMKEITSLTDTERQMMCNRCCHAMTFEEAVRNDERIKAKRLAELLAGATLVQIEPGSHLFIGGVGGIGTAEEVNEILGEVTALRDSVGAGKVWLFENDIDVKAMPAEVIAEQLLELAHLPEVAQALEEFIAKRNRINGGPSGVVG